MPLGEARRRGREDFSILETSRDTAGAVRWRQVRIEGRTPAIAEGLTTTGAGVPGRAPGAADVTWDSILRAIDDRWTKLDEQPTAEEAAAELGFSIQRVRQVTSTRGGYRAAVAEVRRRREASIE